MNISWLLNHSLSHRWQLYGMCDKLDKSENFSGMPKKFKITIKINNKQIKWLGEYIFSMSWNDAIVVW